MKRTNEILEFFDRIDELFHGCVLSKDDYNNNFLKLENEADAFKKYFNLDNDEIILLGVLFNIQMIEEDISLNKIRDFFGCSGAFSLTFKPLIDSLKLKGYLSPISNKRKSAVEPSFIISPHAYRSIVYMRSMPEKQELNKVETADDLFELIENEYDELSSGYLFNEELVNRLMNLLNEHKDKFIVAARLLEAKNVLSDQEFQLLAILLISYVDGKTKWNIERLINVSFDNLTNKRRLSSRVFEDSSGLVKNQWIDVPDLGFEDDDEFSLSENAIQHFLSAEFKKLKRNVDLSLFTEINYESIIEKELFYSPTLQLNVDDISKLFVHEQTIMDNLKKSGYNRNINILFYGYPGTGKTELAKQLARIHKRNILQVDMSKLRNKYVGESEKNIDKIFEKYAEYKNNFSDTPILLLDEADAMIGKRINVAHSTDQMHNTMQNILLQRVETFSGILIATTNLENNLDDAFNRRFLFKLSFGKPDMNARVSILTNQFQSISKEEAEALCEKYEITGAQISNVKKRLLLKELTGCHIDNTLLDQYIAEELGFKVKKTIGFKQGTDVSEKVIARISE